MKKQIVNSIAISFISQIISIAVGLTYTPLMIRVLGQDEYGLYQLAQSVVSYLNLMNLGFNGAYIRYYSIARTKNDKTEIDNINGMFMKAFLLIAILCLVAGFVLTANISAIGNQITKNQYAKAKVLMVMMVINIAISFPNSLYTAFMAANERFAFQRAIDIVFNILVPLLNIPLLYIGLGSVGVVSVTLFLSTSRLLVNALYCKMRLNYKSNLRYFNKTIFKDLFRFTFFIFLSDMVDQLNSNVDKLLLGGLMGTATVAVYSVSYSLNQYKTILSWIIPELYIPKINRLVIEEKDKEGTSLVFTKVGRFNNYLMVLVISGFALLGKEFVVLWVGDAYYLSYYCALILMVSGYISAVQTLGVNVQNAMNMHRARSIIYFVIACANVVLSIFLIRYFGVIGTCIGTFLASMLGTGVFMNYYYKVKLGLDIKLFWRQIIHWLVPSLLYFACSFIILNYIEIKGWLALLTTAIFYTIGYIMLLWIIDLDEETKNKIISKSKKCFGMIYYDK